MRSTRQFSITLPDELADAVRAMVASGEYADESEVVVAGLRTLFARGSAFETWLQHDAASAYDRLRADPGRSVTISDVRLRLAAAHAKASTKT